MSDAPLDTAAFAERILDLLDDGSFTATYKFAVLLGLMDLCVECTTKQADPPKTVTTVQLADKVVELYWRQVSHYAGTGRVLEQNAGSARGTTAGMSARIPKAIADFRRRHGESMTRFELRVRARAEFERLLRDVEWTLVEMPLPKLQRVGNSEDRFVYEIAWDDDIRRGSWSDRTTFDNRIRFVGDAAKHLVRLSSLLRPLIQQRWAAKVAALNRLEIGLLEQFLFGVDRAALTRIAQPLLELGRNHCFYCEGRIEARGQLHVDHFIPWCRHPDDGLDNLVVAHQKCNLAKKDFLAGHQHLKRWMMRADSAEKELERIATEVAWPRDKEKTHSSARAAYLQTASRGQRLWLLGRDFEPAHHDEIKLALRL